MMHWFKDSDWIDERDRRHISVGQMNDMYKHFHAMYSETFFDTASNHRLCEDAIQALKSTHISGKPLFLHNYVMLLRETYSHAHYNIFDLLCDDRRTVRLRFWQHIVLIYRVVLHKSNKAWSSISGTAKACANRLTILLHFASLYSIYKDVAHSAFIAELTDEADRIVCGTQENRTPSEREQIREYLEAIHMIYKLRHVQRRRSFLQRGDEDDVRERTRSAASEEGNQLRSNALGEIMAETSDDDKLMRELEEYKKEREEEKARKAAARAQKPSSSSLNTVQIEIEQMKTLNTIGKEWTEMQSAKEDEEEKIDDGESSNSTASTVYLPQGQSELFRSVADEIKQKFERQKEEDDDESEVPKLILPSNDNRSGLMRTRSWQPRSRMEGRKRTDELQLSMRLVEKSKDEIKESDEEKKSSEERTKQLERQSTVDRPEEATDDVDTQQTSEDEPNLGQFSRRYAIRRRSAPVVISLKESNALNETAVQNQRRPSRMLTTELESIQESR